MTVRAMRRAVTSQRETRRGPREDWTAGAWARGREQAGGATGGHGGGRGETAGNTAGGGGTKSCIGAAEPAAPPKSSQPPPPSRFPAARARSPAGPRPRAVAVI